MTAVAENVGCNQVWASLLGVRLDSGDMIELSVAVRRMLDENGLQAVKIYASSGFDEFTIADAIAHGAPIDAFGVGTKVGVSADAPFLDVVYKLAQYEDRSVRKLSPRKITLGGKNRFCGNTMHREAITRISSRCGMRPCPELNRCSQR